MELRHRFAFRYGRRPQGNITVSTSGIVYIVTTKRNVYAYADGSWSSATALTLGDPAITDDALACAVSPKDGNMYVAAADRRVYKVPIVFNVLGTTGTAETTVAGTDAINGMAIDIDGNYYYALGSSEVGVAVESVPTDPRLFVSDKAFSRIYTVFNNVFSLESELPEGVESLDDIAAGPESELYAINQDDGAIYSSNKPEFIKRDPTQNNDHDPAESEIP